MTQARVVVQFSLAVAAVSDRRPFDPIDCGGRRPPLQQTEPVTEARVVSQFGCEAAKEFRVPKGPTVSSRRF
jgi:hypothetical protein